MTKEEHLKSLLDNIFTTKQIVTDILAVLKTDKHRQILIEELENGLKDKGVIMLMSFDIANGLEV
ncbi:hypothetical protein IKP85_00055 [bacterium]|jgi:hypothetical protein|nr:hypothetical protein [bacterium]